MQTKAQQAAKVEYRNVLEVTYRDPDTGERKVWGKVVEPGIKATLSVFDDDAYEQKKAVINMVRRMIDAQNEKDMRFLKEDHPDIVRRTAIRKTLGARFPGEVVLVEVAA